jgi:Na+-transporting NADH:ubiquinone oxidoreductase subunit A
VFVNERDYGNFSVIPFFFTLYSRSFLLLLRQINETIILNKRMANVIKLRKGLDINLKGAAAQELVSVKEPGFYSLVPDDYTGITPKVVVKEQEYVIKKVIEFVAK